MIHACYACGNDIEGLPLQLQAIANEGIEHRLCSRCHSQLWNTNVFRFVTRCVTEAVKPYLNRTTEPAPGGVYDQELAGVLGDDFDVLDRKANEQLLRSREASIDRVRLQNLEAHFVWLRGVVDSHTADLSWLRHALSPKSGPEDETEMRFDSPKFQKAIDEIRAYNEEAARRADLDRELSDIAAKANIYEVQLGRQPATDDPWKHRSAGMSCKTCMWFVRKEKSGPQPTDAREVGRCRRHCPTMNGYPVVFVSDWCGDHKLDENKA